MRVLLAVSLLVALLVPVVPLLPTAAAQEPSLGVRVLEDPAGDVVLANPSGTPVPAATDRMRFLDLVAVDLDEQPDGYFVRLTLAGLQPVPRVALVEEGFYRIEFSHGDIRYAVGFQFLQGEMAWLEADSSGSGEFDTLATFDMQVDAPASRLSTFVPRALLADRDGAPPFPGRSLAGFTALARGAGTATAIDVPVAGQRIDLSTYGRDDAAAPAGFTLPVLFGAEQSGSARLFAERPFRASNGEAATFIFEVEAANLGDGERLYRLDATGVPAGWHVTFPEPQLRLGGKDSQTVAVLATVPFAHQHGRIASFLVELRDLQDAGSIGRVEIGLHYTDPAQPAGHHPELYLHSQAMGELETAISSVFAGFRQPVSMNTRLEDPHDDAVDVSGQWAELDPAANRYSWEWMVPLSPHLGMGLDFDLARQGTISIPVGTTLALPAARLEGTLYAARGVSDDVTFDIDGYPVATIPATADTDLLPASEHTFESAIVPLEAGDFVPYDPELNLLLVLNLSAGRPSFITGPEAPVLKPGGHLALPLLEYADPVDDLFALAGDLELQLPEGAERRAPPGGSVAVTLRGVGTAGHYEIRALGVESAWVRLPGGLHVGDDGLGEAVLAIEVPADTPAGTVVDFVLEVVGGPDDAVRSLARLRLTADPAAPDAGEIEVSGGGAKDAPGAGVVGLLLSLSLLTAALARRRKA